MTLNAQTLASFQAYQLAFSQHLRDEKNPAPAGIVKKRMAVYQEIVFYNLFQAVSACFPIAQKILGKRRWQKLVKDFFKYHAANSPFFREIPAEFLFFLSNQNTENLPEYFLSLCHYEWIELALTNRKSDDLSSKHKILTSTDLLNFELVFISEMELLSYEYSVHEISEKNKPKQKQHTYLLVYRNAEFDVKFVVLNEITFTLLRLLKDEKYTGKAALNEIATQLHHPNLDEIMQFGLAMLEDFYHQGIIVGANKADFNQN